MSATKRSLASVILAIGVGAGIWGTQHREMSRLRSERERLVAKKNGGELEGVGEPSRVSEAGPKGQEKEPLTSGEKLELMALRRKATELSDVRRRMALATAENDGLRARMAQISNRLANPFPPGWKKRSEVRMAGFASPQAAFETFLWAMQQRDTNLLLTSVAPEYRERTIRSLEESGREAFWQKANQIPMFHFQKVTPEGEDRVTMDLELMPGAPPVELKAMKEAGGWRIEIVL